MIITISGYGGSGKTHVAKMLAQRLGYKHYSTGGFRRQVAERHGMTIDELNKIGETEFWTDKECDDITIAMSKKEDDFVIDSWMAWHFIPHARKIYLTVDPHVAAERIFKNQRPTEQKQETVEGTYKMNVHRVEHNRQRYLKWYNQDIFDMDNYDVVIDTTKLTPEQVVEKILEKI